MNVYDACMMHHYIYYFTYFSFNTIPHACDPNIFLLLGSMNIITEDLIFNFFHKYLHLRNFEYSGIKLKYLLHTYN